MDIAMQALALPPLQPLEQPQNDGEMGKKETRKRRFVTKKPSARAHVRALRDDDDDDDDRNVDGGDGEAANDRVGDKQSLGDGECEGQDCEGEEEENDDEEHEEHAEEKRKVLKRPAAAAAKEEAEGSSGKESKWINTKKLFFGMSESLGEFMIYVYMPSNMISALTGYRNRCKKKAFDKMWQSYSKEFQDHFDNNMSRHEQTDFVNQAMSLDSRGRYKNGVMARYKMLEEIETARTKQSQWSSDGCILEVAAAKCGGIDALRAAVSRGAVKIQVQGGVEMYTFPSIGTTVRDKKSKTVKSLADTPVTEEMHNQMRDLQYMRKIIESRAPPKPHLTKQVLSTLNHNLFWEGGGGTELGKTIIQTNIHTYTHPKDDHQLELGGLPSQRSLLDMPTAASSSVMPTHPSCSLMPTPGSSSLAMVPLPSMSSQGDINGEFEADEDIMNTLALKIKKAEVRTLRKAFALKLLQPRSPKPPPPKKKHTQNIRKNMCFCPQFS